MADSKVPCPKCGGRGEIAFSTDVVPCAECDGTGKITVTVEKQIAKESAGA